MHKRIFTQELEGTRRRGRPRKGWREEVETDLQVLGVKRWREVVIGKNGGLLVDRPKPTAGCSARRRTRRRRRRRRRRRMVLLIAVINPSEMLKIKTARAWQLTL